MKPVDELVERISEAAMAAFDGHVRGVILKGSVLKPADFIPYWSDVDVHVFVDSAAMRGPRTPDVDRALDFQARLGPAEPDDYGIWQWQVYFIDAARYPEDWAPPVPGSYVILHGDVPERFHTIGTDEMLAEARDTLSISRDRADTLIVQVLDKPDSALSRTVRLIGCWLKPAAYAAASLMSGEPQETWRRSLAEVTAACEPAVWPSGSFSSFFTQARRWQTVREDPDALRRMLRTGIQALDEAGDWHERR